MSRQDVLSTLGGQHDKALVLPLVTRHAAELEQVPFVKALSDPDTASRSLSHAQGLYGLDIVLAAGPDILGLSARAAAQPGVPLPMLAQEHARGARLTVLPDPEDVAASRPAVVLVGVLHRLRALLRDRAGTGLALPTSTLLAHSVGHPDEIDWAQDACGAVLRAAGDAEPDVVVEIGDGPSAGQISGLCAFFGAALLLAGEEPTPGVVALTGDEFPSLTAGTGWIYTTTTEVPANAEPKRMTDAIHRARSITTMTGRQ